MKITIVYYDREKTVRETRGDQHKVRSAPSKILRSVAETGCLPRVYVRQMPA